MKEQGLEKEKGGHGDDVQHGAEVTITVNNVGYKIHRGHRTVAEIKAVAYVPLADDLEQIVDGKLTPLADDGSITIKGGEIFMSHVKDGSSS